MPHRGRTVLGAEGAGGHSELPGALQVARGLHPSSSLGAVQARVSVRPDLSVSLRGLGSSLGPVGSVPSPEMHPDVLV